MIMFSWRIVSKCGSLFLHVPQNIMSYIYTYIVVDNDNCHEDIDDDDDEDLTDITTITYKIQNVCVCVQEF